MLFSLESCHLLPFISLKIGENVTEGHTHFWVILDFKAVDWLTFTSEKYFSPTQKANTMTIPSLPRLFHLQTGINTCFELVSLFLAWRYEQISRLAV
jgi:hypothetical protein